MTVTSTGATNYETTYDLRGAAKRRLQRIQGNEATDDQYARFRSQLDNNKRAFDEQMQLQRSGLESMAIRSRNAESLSQWGSDLLGRVNTALNPWQTGQIGGGAGGGGESHGHQHPRHAGTECADPFAHRRGHHPQPGGADLWLYF